MMTCNIHDIPGEYAITADHGQQVYDQIHRDLLDGRSVELGFAEVKVFASPFFNFAIGQLLKDISTRHQGISAFEAISCALTSPQADWLLN